MNSAYVQTFGFWGPSDNLLLDDKSFAIASKAIEDTVILDKMALKTIENDGLDKSIFLPGGFWTEGNVVTSDRVLHNKSRFAINFLRMYCFNFTGHYLMTLNDIEHSGLPPIPTDINELDKITRSHSNDKLDIRVIQHAVETASLPEELRVYPPKIFGEVGWILKDGISNLDVWLTQKRINALYNSSILGFLKTKIKSGKRPKIVEIGAGYGALAHKLLSMMPELTYVIIDLPTSLSFSHPYLSVLHQDLSCVAPLPDAKPISIEDKNIIFLANYLTSQYEQYIEGADIVINTMSLSEMSMNQVMHYAALVARAIGRDGIFFEQNYITLAGHTNILPVLSHFFAHSLRVPDGRLSHGEDSRAMLWANSDIGTLLKESH